MSQNYSILKSFLIVLRPHERWRRKLYKVELRHTATNCCDKSPRLHCCCDRSLALILSLPISYGFKPVWICATDRSDKILSQRHSFSNDTRGDLLQQPVAATRGSDLSHCVSAFSNLRVLRGMNSIRHATKSLLTSVKFRKIL